MEPAERYEKDTEFRLLVDLLTHQIIRCKCTPSEVKQAAVLAAIRYETIYARPMFEVDMATGDLARKDGYHGRCTCKENARSEEMHGSRCPVHG